MGFSQQRLAELIIYFAHNNKSDPFFGSTKLNKLLFIADFFAYGYLGESITGATYIHQKQGPTPDPRQFLPTRQFLLDEGRLNIKEEKTYDGTRKRPITDEYPNTALFTREELQICDDAIESLKHMNNHESSNWSHSFPGWINTKEGEEIPYSTVFLWRRVEPILEDYIWARRMLEGLDS